MFIWSKLKIVLVFTKFNAQEYIIILVYYEIEKTIT